MPAAALALSNWGVFPPNVLYCVVWCRQDLCAHSCIWSQFTPCAQDKQLPLPSRKAPQEVDATTSKIAWDLLFSSWSDLVDTRCFL